MLFLGLRSANRMMPPWLLCNIGKIVCWCAATDGVFALWREIGYRKDGTTYSGNQLLDRVKSSSYSQLYSFADEYMDLYEQRNRLIHDLVLVVASDDRIKTVPPHTKSVDFDMVRVMSLTEQWFSLFRRLTELTQNASVDDVCDHWPFDRDDKEGTPDHEDH